MIGSFLGVLPILTPPLCALAFIMCSKSNPLVVFALDLMSTYEGGHTIFGLLGQANLTQNDVLQFHPFTPWWVLSHRHVPSSPRSAHSRAGWHCEPLWSVDSLVYPHSTSQALCHLANTCSRSGLGQEQRCCPGLFQMGYKPPVSKTPECRRL
jgi:hypothetical protein